MRGKQVSTTILVSRSTMLDFYQPSEFVTKIRDLYQHMVKTPSVNLNLRGRAEHRLPGIEVNAQAQGEREQDSATENRKGVFQKGTCSQGQMQQTQKIQGLKDSHRSW